jgi:hypothetical protein
MSRAKTPLDEVAQSIALAGSFKNPNSPDKRALQFPYPIPKVLPAITASQQRQRPDILPFSTSISSEREAREKADLEEDERRLKEEEHDAFLAHMRAKDDAERAILKLREEMIRILAKFNFSDPSAWKLPSQILSYFRSLSSNERENFVQSVKSRFMANLDHAILKYEHVQSNSKQAGVFAPDVIATRLSSELLLDSKKKGAKLNIPYLCEAVLRSKMIDLKLLEKEEESELSSEPKSRQEKRKLQQQEQQQQKMLSSKHSNSNEHDVTGLKPTDFFHSSSSSSSFIFENEGDNVNSDNDGGKNNNEANDHSSQHQIMSSSDRNTSQVLSSSSTSSIIDNVKRSEPRSSFWAQKRGGGLITDAVGSVKHGETMNMLTNVWLAERGITTTAADVRSTLAQSLDLNELRMTDSAAADYVDTLLVGDDVGRNSKTFLKNAYAASNKWMSEPVFRGEDHGDGKDSEIRAHSVSDSLGVTGSNGLVTSLRVALGSRMRDSPASIATLSSKATITSLQSMLKRRNDKAASALVEIENAIQMKKKQDAASSSSFFFSSSPSSSSSSSYVQKRGKKPPVHEQVLSSKEDRALVASIEDVKASQAVFDFKVSALSSSSSSSSSSSHTPDNEKGDNLPISSSSSTLPLGGVRLSVTEIAPSLTSRVILQRKNVVVVSQDNTPSTSDTLAGRRTMDEVNMLYKGGRVEAIHRLPILPQPEPALVETRDDQVPIVSSHQQQFLTMLNSKLEGSDFSSHITQRTLSLGTSSNETSNRSTNVPAPIFQHSLVSESLRRALEPRTAVDTEDIHAKSRRRKTFGNKEEKGGRGGEERPSTPEGLEDSKAHDKKINNQSRRMSSSSSSSSSTSPSLSSSLSRTKWFHQHGYTRGASVSQAPTQNTSIAALLGPFSAKRLLVEQGVRDSGDLVLMKVGALKAIRNNSNSASGSITEGSRTSSCAPNSSMFSDLTTATPLGVSSSSSKSDDVLVQSLLDSNSLPLSAGTRSRVLGKAGAANPLMSFKIKEKTADQPMQKQISMKKGLYLI